MNLRDTTEPTTLNIYDEEKQKILVRMYKLNALQLSKFQNLATSIKFIKYLGVLHILTSVRDNLVKYPQSSQELIHISDSSKFSLWTIKYNKINNVLFLLVQQISWELRKKMTFFLMRHQWNAVVFINYDYLF